MDACRNYASAGSNATNPILFEPMIMSILAQSQQVKISRLEKTLDAVKRSVSKIRGGIFDVYPSDIGQMAVWIIS